MNIRGKDDCDRRGEDGEDECGPEGKDRGRCDSRDMITMLIKMIDD